MKENCVAVVLAAGKGTRLYSKHPKVLRPILGEPMLGYVYEELAGLTGKIITVAGFGADLVAGAFPEKAPGFVLQEPQLGTGHALQCAWPALTQAGCAYVLLVNGDTPLAPAAVYAGLIQTTLAANADLGFITLTLPSNTDFGRVIRRADGRVAAIVEVKDFDPARHGPDTGEVNAGIYCLKTESIGPLLGRLTNDNKSREYYVTDLIGLAVAAGLSVVAANHGHARELMGINSPLDLTRAEEHLRARIARDWEEQGVIIRQAGSVRIGPKTTIAPGVDITGPCEIFGETRIASGVIVEPFCLVKDTVLAEDAVVHAFSHLEGALVGPGCAVGPYARLRPGAVLGEKARVGNFVEVKKSVLAKGVKANHLSYLGDAQIGEGTNVGAGTITCNYDGVNKHKTVIGERAFIGSNTALVAPVTVGADALVAAGSVITKDVPEGMLGLGRAKQENKPRRKIKP